MGSLRHSLPSDHARESLHVCPSYEDYEKYGIRRYGFHGTSHRYVSRRACEFLGLDYDKQRIITCHIGNGGSITAIRDGKSVDTSMGLTPTEGLMMGTRVGDVDPGALTYLMERRDIGYKELQKIINKESGVLGCRAYPTTCATSRMESKPATNAPSLAMDMYEYHILKYIGAYTAVLGGADVIVFTGGVGENQTSTRETICKRASHTSE